MTTHSSISRLIRPEVRALSAYKVVPAQGYVKLDAMENPYPLPEILIDEWLASLRELELNRYPDAGAEVLKEQLRAYLSLDAEQEVLLGNGSDELIQMIVMALAKPGATIMAPEPGFVMYRIVAQSLGMEYVGVPLDANSFTLDLAAMLSSIDQHDPAVIFLAYPNNPTGNLFDRAEVEAIIAATNGIVVIDEAYFSFAQDSWIADLGQFENVVVMRTLSKIGLAGLRIGMLAGPAHWLNEFDKVRLPYNINVLSQASASFMLSHINVFDDQAAQIRSDREDVFTALTALPDLDVWTSRANFILLRSMRSQLIFNSLKDKKILIKNLHGSHPMLEQCLRVTIGTQKENSAVLNVISSI